MPTRFTRLLPWIWTLLFGCLILVQELLGPRAGDGVEYGFVYPVADGVNDYRRIASLGDLVESQTNFYMHENGRVVVHSIIQPLCAIRSPWIFAILDAAVFLLLVVLLMRWLRWKPDSRHLMLLSALAFFYILPCSTDIAFQVNYLWVATLVVGFLLAFFRSPKPRLWVWPLFLLLAFATGQSNEAFTAGLGIGVLVWLIRRYRSASVLQWLMAALFLAGLLLNLFAPGNWIKLSHFIPSPLLRRLFEYGMNNWILLLPPAVLWLRRRQIDLRQWVRANSFLLIALAGQIVTLLILRAVYLYASMGTRLFTILLLLSAIKGWRLRAGWLWLVMTVVVALGVQMLTKNIALGRKYTYIQQTYMQSPSGKVILPISMLEPEYRSTTAMSAPFTWVRRATETSAPPVEVIPEGLESFPADLDTNMIWQADERTWFIIESKSRPRPLDMLKRLRIDTTAVISRRPLNFTRGAMLEYWSETDAHTVGVYYNHYPWLFDVEFVESEK